MAEEKFFDYYYGDESSQFSFYRIPRQLVTGDNFKRLSTNAKLLYGLLEPIFQEWLNPPARQYAYCLLPETASDSAPAG